MTKHFCDVCGADLGVDAFVVGTSRRPSGLRLGYDPTVDRQFAYKNGYELCESCAKKVSEFLDKSGSISTFPSLDHACLEFMGRVRQGTAPLVVKHDTVTNIVAGAVKCRCAHDADSVIDAMKKAVSFRG